MPNGYAEETLPELYRREDYEAYAAWVEATYLSRYMSQTRDYERAQAWLKATIEDPQVLDYWQRFVKSAGVPARGAFGLLSTEEYGRRLEQELARRVASLPEWDEARKDVEMRRAAEYIAEHGVTLEAPLYYSLEQQAPIFTGAATRADPFRFGRVPTPEGGERGVTEAEYRRMIGGVGGAPFLESPVAPGLPPGAVPGPLGFGAARRPGEPAVGAREAVAAARGVGEMPSAMVPFYEMVEGLASPAMQQFFRSQFPYLMTMFGGEEKRQEWWTGKQQRAAEAARLAAKRRGQQWVLGKKEEYLPRPGVVGGAYPYGPPPAGTSYQESYQATQQRIESLRRREAGVRGIAEPRDPWLAHLEQFPFLEKFIRTPPQQRGFFPARYAPVTRWL